MSIPTTNHNNNTIITFLTITTSSIVLVSTCYYYYTNKYSTKKSNNKKILGVDIGGTNVKLGLCDLQSGKLDAVWNVGLVEPKSPESVAIQVRELLRGRDLHDVVGIGICCPGRVENNCATTLANFPVSWKEARLTDIFLQVLGLNSKKHCTMLALVNDAKAALLGEVWSGAGEGSKHVVLLTLGTGVGAGVMSNGVVLHGSTGMFGEIGHSIFAIDSPTPRYSSATGIYGITEEYCSARAIMTTWNSLLANTTTITTNTMNIPTSVNQIFELAHTQQDPFAMKVLDLYADHVGSLVINSARCYDPEIIVIAGGVVEAGDWFVEKIQQAAEKKQWTLAPPTFKIKKAVYGQWAGVVGAARAAVMSATTTTTNQQ
jgi:glucokinase